MCIRDRAKEEGASGLAYFTFEKDKDISAKGPIGNSFLKMHWLKS